MRSGCGACSPPEVFKLGEPGHVEYSSVTVVLGRRTPPLKRAEAGRRDAEREKNLQLAREAVGRGDRTVARGHAHGAVSSKTCFLGAAGAKALFVLRGMRFKWERRPTFSRCTGARGRYRGRVRCKTCVTIHLLHGSRSAAILAGRASTRFDALASPSWSERRTRSQAAAATWPGARSAAGCGTHDRSRPARAFAPLAKQCTPRGAVPGGAHRIDPRRDRLRCRRPPSDRGRRAQAENAPIRSHLSGSDRTRRAVH